jgi:hypothetical protein
MSDGFAWTIVVELAVIIGLLVGLVFGPRK